MPFIYGTIKIIQIRNVTDRQFLLAVTIPFLTVNRVTDNAYDAYF